jgi:hypothetical protein
MTIKISGSFIFIRIVPESIRWLISKQRYEEAGKLISKAAKVNGKVIPDYLLLSPISSVSSQENKSEQLVYILYYSSLTYIYLL